MQVKILTSTMKVKTQRASQRQLVEPHPPKLRVMIGHERLTCHSKCWLSEIQPVTTRSSEIRPNPQPAPFRPRLPSAPGSLPPQAPGPTRVFTMHKSVVTCGSEYFRAMLEHEMAESA